ncbi:hypothetical protein Vadar_004081 [Vaccinium darrowii]|uniref:Uncharacterized protein n=1 Tax=Vaccinium darrowii TaxID=229202 RepID=A0ACB7YTV2_9ERIC|nr:hypothetical protein Vadar_004081 [Vaccinium darrowii]
MNSLKPKHHEPPSPRPNPPNLNLQQALTHLQTQCSSFLHHHHHHHHNLFKVPFLNPNPSLLKTHLDSTLSTVSSFLHHHHHHPLFKIPFLNPDPSLLKTHLDSTLSNLSSFLHDHHRHTLFKIPFLKPDPSLLKTHLDSTLSNLHHHAKQAFEAGFSILAKKIENQASARAGSALASANGVVEERLTGVHVYALGNASEEFVLVSGVNTGKSVGLFCFEVKDAEALLDQMKSMDPGMREGSKVVAVPLNKVFQLKLDGVAFRLIPELSQVKNALKERQKAGFADDSFPGVPVFQSENLILRSQDKKYRPVFFRKEDLENSLSRASRQQMQLNPAFREGNIQVAVLEDIIQRMKEQTSSTWDDVVFIPPGFDVSTNPPRE